MNTGGKGRGDGKRRSKEEQFHTIKMYFLYWGWEGQGGGNLMVS